MSLQTTSWENGKYADCRMSRRTTKSRLAMTEKVNRKVRTAEYLVWVVRVHVYGSKFIASGWKKHETSGFGGWRSIRRLIKTIKDWVKNIIDWWSKDSCNGNYRGNDRWRPSGRNIFRWRSGVKIGLGVMFNLGHSKFLKPI